MSEHRVTREQAFDLLRMASQNTNRKLTEVARDVGDTGVLDLPRSAAQAGRPGPATRPRGDSTPAAETGRGRR